MIERDWTIADQADAADAEYDRNWWRRDSSLCPWPDDNYADVHDGYPFGSDDDTAPAPVTSDGEASNGREADGGRPDPKDPTP